MGLLTMGEVVPPIPLAEDYPALRKALQFASHDAVAEYQALRAERDYYRQVYRELVERHGTERTELVAVRQALTDLMGTIHFFDRGDEYRRARAVLAGDQ
jgi:hypothetical protein